MKYRLKVVVEPDAKATEYNPMIFGGFLEHFGSQVYGGVFQPGSPLSDRNGFRRDVVEAIKELKAPIIRWPGGCYVSGYHWEDGVGASRTPTDDMAWGVIEPHTFGTDEFIRLCRLLECEPYICNNAGNGTVPEMKSWVEYTNAGAGRRGVDYWSIGNENWGKHEIGYKPIEEWAPLVAEAAAEMKSADPDIRLSAATLAAKEWTLPLLKTAGQFLDYISIHGYWLSLHQENRMPDYLTCIMESEGPEERIKMAIEGLDESGYRGRIKIAFDEWNLRGWYHPGFPRKEVQDYNDPEVAGLVAAREENLIPSQYTMADALFSASFLNACLRHPEDVGMANIAPLVNTRGPLYVHPDGIVKRTHFHALSMYANLLGSHVVDAEITADPLIHGGRSVGVADVVVTTNGEGDTWSIVLVNRHPTETVECEVALGGVVIEGVYGATVLSGDSTDAFNDINRPDRVTPEKKQVEFRDGVVSIPPHSLTILRYKFP